MENRCAPALLPAQQRPYPTDPPSHELLGHPRMEAAGDGIGDRSACQNYGTVASARQLSSDDCCLYQFTPEVVARSMPVLRALRKAHQHCDVAFRTTDGAEFLAHRFVPAARYAGCDAFCAGLGLVVESMPALQDIAGPPLSAVLVSGLSSETLELIIDLAYHVPLHERVGLHYGREVLDVAEALGITEVRDHCLRLLRENLEPENCIGAYQLASSKGYGLLSSDAFRYIVRHFDKVWTTSAQFQLLMPDELRSLLYDDELNAPNDVEWAFGAILKWIAGNVEDMRGHPPRLLPLIRFAFCSRADIEKVENDPLVRAGEAAFEALIVIQRTLNQESIDDVYWRDRPDLSERRWLQPRVPKDVLFMLGGWSDGATSHLTYNCRSSRWLIQPNQRPPPRAYHGVAMLDGLVYFVGGFDGHDCYHTVVCLDVSQLDCTTRSNMQVARCYVSVAVLQGYIYTMGGLDGDGRTSSCERYDAKSNQWEVVASMHAVRSDACAAAAAGRIYVMGSITGLEVLDAVERYDPSTDAWFYVPNMSSPRSGLKALVHHMIYVVGGFDGAFRLQSVERLDARRGRWSQLPSMTFARSNFGAVLLEGSIYVAGAWVRRRYDSVARRAVYDIQAGQWHRAPYT